MRPLTPQQVQAITLLTQGKTYVEVAAELDLNRITIGRWMARPDFAAALNAQQYEIQRRVNAELRNMQTRAIETLDSLLDDPDIGGRTRLDAAKFVLDKAASLPQPDQEGLSFAVLEQAVYMHCDSNDRIAAMICEGLGLVESAEQYLTFGQHQKMNLAVACENISALLQTGEFWQPPPGDLLVEELIRTHAASAAETN